MFYRLHNTDSHVPDRYVSPTGTVPCFCAEHAYSAVWGAEWSADGSRTKCRNCEDGISLIDGTECGGCDGGWEDALYGYSSCDTAEELVAYMTKHGVVNDDDLVVAFEGEQVGNGWDGEPLVVPTHVVEVITWAELRTRASAAT
jgi:hypothetical protein